MSDDKYQDLSEWHDMDVKFMQKHPDWGSDSIVKQYFKDAQNRPKYEPFKLEHDTTKWERIYEAIRKNETKKAEKSDRYDSHPTTDPALEGKPTANATSAIISAKADASTAKAPATETPAAAPAASMEKVVAPKPPVQS